MHSFEEVEMIVTARPLIAVLVAFLASAASAIAQPAATWGMVFPTSQTGGAQQHFLEGVTAMHLHMFEDAEEHFQAAQRVAPDFAMAYWGEALNQHRTIWSYHDATKARAALARLGPTPDARAAKAPTAREKRYLAAIEALFGSGTQSARELAYSQAMRQLSEAFPDDTEALAWYCLSLMRVTTPGLTRSQTRMDMASAALRVLARNPSHPGANRYLIQSTDDPVHSTIGWLAVENLRRIQATAAEALHVPSHVYIQHGLWHEAAEANMRAFDASMAWTKAHGWKLADLNLHNYGHLLNFANYAYLQSGQLSKAEALRERVRSDYEASGHAPELRRWFADLFARCVVELAEWESARPLAEKARQDRIEDPSLWLAIGLGAARSNDLALAREALAVVSKAEGGPDNLAAREIAGMILLGEGQTDRALRALEEAADIDARNLSRIGTPPQPIKPAMELYGEVLLERGRATEALEQFERGLTIFRRRPLMLAGAAQASERLGREVEAARYVRELQDVWRSADADHPWAAEIGKKVTQH
jgi:tetratricopeptide (TPR) repeat protein